MNIYFSGSISGGRDDVGLYQRIVAFLEHEGHDVISGEVANPGIQHEGESLDPNAIFERDLGWIRNVSQAGGLLVAEVSRPSLGVGYEIAAARYQFAMPAICLWRPAHTRRCSAMISGDTQIRLIEYNDHSEEWMLEQLAEAIDATPRADHRN